jgi:hypothetical protein
MSKLAIEAMTRDRSIILLRNTSLTHGQLDRETLRAIATLFQRSMTEFHGFLDEVRPRVVAETMIDAERVAGHSGHVTADLSGSLRIRAGFHYLVAADRVLTELCAELQQQWPSPTRLKQLIAQYAVDARRRVEVPAEHIDIRSLEDGYEIVISNAGHPSLQSPSHSVVPVRSPFTRRLIEIALQEPPRYIELIQFIETMLGYMAGQHRGTIHHLTVITPANAVQVDREDSSICVFGRRYVVDPLLVVFVEALLATPGAWVPPRVYGKDLPSDGFRMDRHLTKLPACLQYLIESCPGKGYRLRVERVEELCQKSSVAQRAPERDDV